MTGGIAYGTTPKQLLRDLGSPKKKEGDCWLYRGNVHGEIGTIRGHYSGPYVDAMKFCFADGPVGGKVVMTIVSHYAPHFILRRNSVTHALSKTFYSGLWAPPVTFMRVPGSSNQGNS